MRWFLSLSVLAACPRLGPTSVTPGTAGDDDDTAPGDDDDDNTGCDPAVDADGDGHNACEDCDDDDALTFPGAIERCDQRDNDCDGNPHADELTTDCAACDAAGFWAPTLALSGDGLIDKLNELTEVHHCVDYSATTTFMFVELDNEGGFVTCVYSSRTAAIVNGEKPDPNDMNTEHSWPQSMGADVEPARCDLHHLFPTDSVSNSQRSNHPYGEVVTDTSTVAGDSRLGRDSGGRTVFEPQDIHKGNVSRAMLYFAMRYDYSLTAQETLLYQTWAASDPVDTREVTRTEAIAVRQQAANPYVLCPWLVDRL